MGTTVVAAALVVTDDTDRLVLANVGDSRAYRFHDGVLDQLSVDHSVAEELVAQGALSEAEAAVHPKRHILTRALGISPQVEVDVWEVVPVEGDRYLLCSDGLSNEVPADVMASVLSLRDPHGRPRPWWAWPTTPGAPTTSPPSSSTSWWARPRRRGHGRRQAAHDLHRRRGTATGVVGAGAVGATGRRRPRPHGRGPGGRAHPTQTYRPAPDHLPRPFLPRSPRGAGLRRLVRHQGLRGRLVFRRAPEGRAGHLPGPSRRVSGPRTQDRHPYRDDHGRCGFDRGPGPAGRGPGADPVGSQPVRDQAWWRPSVPRRPPASCTATTTHSTTVPTDDHRGGDGGALTWPDGSAGSGWGWSPASSSSSSSSTTSRW